MSLNELRKEIDLIDNEILNLFIKRLEYAERVADIKIRENIPVLNEKREEEILNSIHNKAPKYKDESERLFSEIMLISKDIQYKKLKSQ